MSTTKNLALVAYTDPVSLKQEELDLPSLGHHQVLVKISHVAQNPTDVQSYDNGALGPGAVYGCDFVGDVISTGSAVTRVSEGDTISALIWGGEIPGLGAYSHYTIADERICFKIPAGVGKAEAATIPLAAATAWLALFSSQSLGIPRVLEGEMQGKVPGRKGEAVRVLVWGGSSSVGQYAIQLAKLEGLTVLTTCSPRNFDLVKSLGADEVVDYNDADAVEKIKAFGQTDYVFDTIGTADSSEQSGLAIDGTGTLCTVRPGKALTEKVPKGVKVTDVLVWTVFLKEHKYKTFIWPPSKEDHELGAELFDRIPLLLTSSKLKPNAVLPLKGLDDVPKGFDLHRNKKISAQKIVYEL
ncbi:GroES-like protein [Pseudovirgaria hyperparasitica]|uniref:GroES-like protein n=1 Tax=Pseudovirgaria hyperparasitica TaxID=470096 RepID=A0A6A6WJL0_9PEZI|nr:GroES-like protein [Pseudovirgaria hyperparasitica]KAF2762455.1 GroES-like protein [Pseudovirgaria hyperparasitica]